MPVMIAIASLLEVIGGEVESREQVEEQLGQRMIQAYELPTEVARCDTSSKACLPPN